MNTKFEFTGETKVHFGVTLKRIRALVAIGSLVAPGELGGWIEKEENLQVSGDAWVYGNARVYGDAWVSGNARVYGNVLVYGNARVYGKIIVATRSDGYTFLVAPTPEGPRIIAGCRYFTFDQGVEHWTKTRGGTQLGDESLLIVNHLKAMAELNGFMEPVKPEDKS